MGSLGSVVPSFRTVTSGYFAVFPLRQFSMQKRQTSWRSKWDSNSRSGRRIFGFENSIEFRASIAKLGPRENFPPKVLSTLLFTCLSDAVGLSVRAIREPKAGNSEPYPNNGTSLFGERTKCELRRAV